MTNKQLRKTNRTKTDQAKKGHAKKLLQLQELNSQQLDRVAAAGFIWLE